MMVEILAVYRHEHFVKILTSEAIVQLVCARNPASSISYTINLTMEPHGRKEKLQDILVTMVARPLAFQLGGGRAVCNSM